MKNLPGFKELNKLSEEELENLRKECINEIINSAQTPEQRDRLKGIQFKIDMEKKRSKNPMEACLRIFSMMQESFLDLKDSLNGDYLTPRKDKKDFKVLDFKKEDNDDS